MKKSLRVSIQLLVCLAFLAVGAAGLAYFKMSKPQVKKRKPPVMAPLVRTQSVAAGPHRVEVVGQGTVRPLHESTLVAQVGGTVVFVSPNLVDGGEVKKGELLIRVDPTDYKLAVTLADAKVAEAATKLQLTQQDAEAAMEEWRRWNAKGKKGSPPPLVAKKPQLDRDRANLQAAQASLRQARVNLERTEITSPFAGRLTAKMVDLGQSVSPGTKLVTLFATAAAEVVVNLDDRALGWFSVPGVTVAGAQGSEAVVIAHFAGQAIRRKGRVVRAVGKVDERTRMVGVVVRVEAPYGELPPMKPGLFVEVIIKGKELARTFIAPRNALHDGDVVWAYHQGTLKYRKVGVVRTAGDYVLITSGLESGDKLIITTLETVVDGMQVRESETLPPLAVERKS